MDQAQRIYEAALLLNPLDPSIHYNMGFLFEVKGEQKRAADSFRRFINLVPAGEQYAKQLQVAQERLASLTSRQ
jgi:Flp pilus assembly protein TadD